MIVFLQRIPVKTVRQDIIDFIEPVVIGKVFQKSGVIQDIEFLTLKDAQTKEVEVHVLVMISPDSAAERVIKKLNRKVFNGKHIAVREYHYRSWHNDPRVNMKESNGDLVNRRKFDRRGQKIKSAGGVKLVGMKNFSRKL